MAAASQSSSVVPPPPPARPRGSLLLARGSDGRHSYCPAPRPQSRSRLRVEGLLARAGPVPRCAASRENRHLARYATAAARHAAALQRATIMCQMRLRTLGSAVAVAAARRSSAILRGTGAHVAGTSYYPGAAASLQLPASSLSTCLLDLRGVVLRTSVPPRGRMFSRWRIFRGKSMHWIFSCGL